MVISNERSELDEKRKLLEFTRKIVGPANRGAVDTSKTQLKRKVGKFIK